jgi:NADH-quinone oxidoreductase subunit J
MIFTRFINSTLLLVTGALVAFAANPVNSAVFLIGAFVSAAILLFFLGVDFLSLVFIVVYVGAIAVLFLFVVMMLAIKNREFNFLSVAFLHQFFKTNFFGFVYLIVCVTVCESVFSFENYYATNDFFIDNFDGLTWFGQFFYNTFPSAFLIAGLVLLVALKGAIMLTHNFFIGFKKPRFEAQLSAGSNGVIMVSYFFVPASAQGGATWLNWFVGVKQPVSQLLSHKKFLLYRLKSQLGEVMSELCTLDNS